MVAVSKDALIARVKQLRVADMNAQDVYQELSLLAKDEKDSEIFERLAMEENRHTTMLNKLLSLLEN